MKTKYNVYSEVGRNPYGQPVLELIEVFKGDKNEANAIRFIEDPQNLQKHGIMILMKRDKNGESYEWNEDERRWC